MNYRDKIQKFSIRKYTVGTFSTVIATLVFLGFNTSQAHAAETNQPASVVKQKQQSNNEQTENRESQAQNSQNSQNGQSLSATHENEQPNISQANLVDQKVAQSTTTNDEQPASQNVNTKKDSATAATTQPDKEEIKHKQNESQSANKNGNDSRAAHVENHEANVVTASDSSDNGNVQHDRNELQAFFDANYHDYRFIDRENTDSGTFNYVKGIFDKINTLLGSNDPINNKDLQLAYKELEQAVALIRTMPQRQQTSRRSNRIQTRSVESRAAEPRSVSDYQNANSSYYVENANDGSGYPVGTYINASSKGAPYNLPTTPWNTLKASDSKEIALMTAKQTGDGYQWVIKFNKGHAPHQNMIFWFALPADQVPVGRTDFVTVNSDGTNVQWSHGAGAGANKPLQQMWEYGVNDPDRSHDFKIRNRSGQVIYDWPTVHIYSLEDLSRASDYFSEAGATPATKAFGRQNFEYINGQKPAESPGVPKVYTFIGQGDASYTISFKTQGPTVNKLYYAAGGRALEYNQLFMYSQLYVESTQDHQQRLNGLRQVVNRTYRIGTTKRVEVSQGNVQTKKVLESTNLNIDDFVDDPLSYVKTPSNKVLGFYSTNANTNAFRPGGAQQLNEYQLSQLFTDQKLQEAARTRNPIRLMIGFDYPDAYGNSETLVPVNLTVLPEIQHNIKFFKNDDTQNIAEKPFSKQAGHPVFYVYAGNQGNASVNLGGSVTSIQPLRINLTSNENFTDKDWQITGIPRTLHIENSTNRTNNARERNIELVGNLLPGDYFGTIRFGRKEQLFEIRVKPHTPTITTTAEQLRGTALQKVPVNISGIPLDPSALVYLVAPTNQTTNGGSEADQIPSGYTILATGTPDGVHNTITIQPKDYVVFIPPVGKQIRAVVYYNKVVASNMSNAVTILPDDIPPTINNPVGINAKYYRGDEVNFTMGVSDRHSGLKSTTITTLPSGWTSNLTKSDNKNGSLSITGRVSMNQAFNSDITFKVSATDNVNNTTNDSQSKHVSIHVGKISEDAHPIVLGNTEKVVVVNPTAVSNDEKQRIITAFMNKNQNIRGYLASTDPVTVDNNGNVTLHYRDGSSTTLEATNVMTYEPIVKPEYQTTNAPKTATVTIAKGQSFSIGDIKQYFTLSNGQPIPIGTFTNITSDRTIPTAQEVSQMNAGTQLYHIVASNAYHKDTEDFYISLKIVDVKQPEGDQRVYRTSTYDLTTDEISKVKQAFINANRDVITLAEGDISVTNTSNGANVSTITVNINKGRLTKSFSSNLANMNFLRWVNFPQDYTVTWTNAKIANRPTDGGLSWSDDHKSLIYRYDATLGTQITTNDILTMLKATTTVPGLRNNITGNEKAQAEAGGRPNYRTTGYSQANASSDGQRQYTLNGQVIQILDIINPSNGYGGQPVTNSNTRANHSNATVVNVNEPAANGAGAFTIDHVVKSNSTHNASDAVYKAQLYLTPYGPKQYVEHLNQNTGNTTDAINIYFVPSDLVNPTISVGNYTNHQVFSGETFTNTITANDNFGVQSVTVPTTSQITGTVDNNHQHVSATAPNVTSATSKTINLLATDTSGNTATTSFNVTVKPLRDKYRVGTSSTAANPVRIANISNNATVSQADQTAIINSLTFTSNAPNRNYATASANEITSKTVSNVSRTGNNANVTVTVTYQDGTTSTVTVPVKHVIPEIVAHSHYTVQGQDFPAGNGSSASDYFKLSNGSAIPDATITWVSGQAPNKDNTLIGEDITVTANILIDGETTPITKTATYKVVRTVPKHVFETARGVLYPGVSDMYDAKQYVKPVNNSWSTNAQHMNFQFVGTYGPNKDVVGISTRLIRVTYDNRQTEDLTILSKVKPDPPRIDANSVTYKAGLTNQEIKVNNVLNNSSVKLFKADNTPLNVTNITHGSGFSSVVTVSDALPNDGIKAKSSISMNNVTYTTQDEHGQVVTVTRNESVDSNDSATVTVTPQLQATSEGAVFIKGGDGFDFGHVERFIQNPPHGATVAWHDSPDTWKNTVGNTHKTAVVTLPNGQGTRNVEVPVKVYPVANAKAPSRDVKGQNLTNGTDAINYITFDPNTNTNGITAAWANRQQPNNQQAGVQHLNVDVTYPGISAAKRVPVTVNVYQFEFPQTSYTTTVGGTLASGTQASGYAHMQNANGLPTDGFTYKWNNAATGTNDANWAAMNKPNAAKVVNAKYDVIYNGHTFATSLPAKFVVKDVQPAKPTITESAAGAITITPGANQTVNTYAGNVTTYADKLVIKRNGNVVTTFTRRNNTSPWVKEASAATVAGIAGTNNGITVAAGTFNPADTIQVVATQGSGETISDEQRSDDFTVVAPQPNHANTKIWQNGHIDITPNNPSGHLINPTQAMDIAYTEKMGNGAEHSKTINVVRGQNNQWTIANKPDYVTLDPQTGKVTFNANTIKPNSVITITPKAGTGHSASSNPSTLTAPATHTVNTTEIVKDYGSNVTAAEINNAVQVASKRTATIKNGTAMPTNLAGGSTTTIPVTVTYNDGSSEEVQESIFTKADKRELITAKNHLDDPVSTDGKKPGTITQYNNAIHNAQQQINTAKTEAQQVINNDRATPQQVNAALSKVQAAQTKINEAKALLQNKEDNSQLVTSKNNLQSSVNQVPSTAGMTQQSIDNYNAKKREAETEITAAQRVIDNGDATAQQISDEKHRVDNALTALNQAKHDLTADTHALEQAVQQLNRTGTTTGKKPASITAYNNSIRALQSDLTSAKNSANAIIQKPIRTVQEVQSALTNVNRVNERLTQAINQLVPLADNSALRTAKTKLDEEINKSVTTDGMTQSSIQAYQNAKRAGQTESTNAQNVINNGDATDQQIAAEKAKVEEKYNSLKQAIAGLTPDLAPLQAAKTQLQNDIDQPTSTTGMTSASVATFNENLAAAKQQANNRLNQLDHLNNAQKQQLQSQITQSSDIAAVNGHKQTAESLNTAMGNLINAIADHQAVEQRGNFINADTDKQNAYTTALNEAEAMINKQTGQNANQTEVEQAITKVQTTLQALNGDHNLQVAKTNATQAIDALTSLNDPQKTALKDQVTAATLVTAVHQIEQNANTLNQAMHGLRESISDNAATKANSKYINEDQPEQQNYDQAVQAANNIINEQTATLDNNAINQAATTVNTTKAALHGDVKLQNDKDHAKQTVSQLAHLNNAQKHMEDTLIDNETTRTAVKQDLTEAQALDQLMDALQQSIADKDATRASSAYVNAEPNKKQAYDEAVQNAESIIAGLNNPTINKGNVSSATQAVTSSKNALDGVERLAQDKQTAGNSLNHLDQLTPAQQQALENQINNATTRDKVAEIIAQAQALNEAMKALKESIKDQPQTEASSKFINEDQAQKDAYTQAVQHAKDLINKTTDPTLVKSVIDQATQAVNDAKNNLHGDQKLAQDKQRATETLNNLSNLNTPQRQALEGQINNAATRGEVAQKLAEAKALNQAMEALRNSIQDQQQTESGSKFINEDKPQKDAYQAAVQHAKDLINQTGNPTLDKSQVEQLTQAVTTAKDNLHGDQKLARDQQQAVTTVNALPNLNHAQQQALTDAINAAPTRTEVAQHVQTATELDHAMETLKNKVDQVNTDKAQPNYTEASTDKKEAVDQALQAAESITDPTNGSNANKDAVEQALTKLQEKVNELNGNERVAEAKTQAKQTIDQLTHLNAEQIATAKQNIDQATKLQPIAELVDQATQLNQSMDQLQQAVNEHANVEQTVDYTQADSDKQNAYKQAIAEAENVLKQNSNKQQVDQALQNILNVKQALNGDERVALAKTNGKHDIDQLNALNNAQQDGFKGRIDQSNDLNQIQQIVDEAKALNRAMDQLSQEITGNEGRTKGSTNYVNSDTQVKQVYDEAVDKAKQALDKSTGQNLTAEQVIKLNDAVTAAKQALNGEERLNNRKSEALQRLDQLTHLNNAQRQLATQQINNAETLNKASRAINRATKLDNAMGAVQQYIDEQHLGVISSTNYINADDNLKANYDNAIANAAHELDKVQGNAIAKAEAEQLKQNIIDAQNALNGDQNLANAKDKANAFVNSLNGLNKQQQDLAHNAINNADTVSDVTDIVNNQIDLNNAMETLKHLVDNEIPNAEQTVNYQNADDNAKTNFDDAKRLANTLLNSDNTNVNDINGAIQSVNDAIQNLNGDQRLQDAKDKAIQSINQALANKLKEIEASNATDQDKLIAKNKAEELANSIINKINKATSNQDVSQVQTAGNQAIEQVHANEIPKAKIDANKDADKQVQALIDEIDRNPNLTVKEKQALKDRINQILQQGHNDINNAMTKEEIEQAKERLAQALQDIKDLVKAKEDAKQDVDKRVQALIDEIDQNPNLTDKEKQALKDRINQILQQGHNDINNAMTKEGIEQAKERLAQALQGIKDLVKAKEDAKQDVDKSVQALIDEIDRNPNLTDKEKQALKDRINQILQQGHNDINNAMTKEEIEQVKERLAQALQDIKDLVKAKEDAKNKIKALANAKRDQINSNPDLTPEQKAKALKEIDEAEKRALQNVENAQTIDQLNRGLNLGLDDIRNTHVWEVDDQPAVNEISEATPEQLLVNGELIVHRDDIITEQDVLAHINLIDQLTAEVIDTPSTATISDSLTAKVEVTLLDGSKVIVNVPVKVVEKELSVVKQQAIESIENAAQQKINEINNSVTLTLEQKEAAIAEVNKLKQQAIDHINNAPDVHSIEEIQQQEQAHIEQFNPEQFTIEQAKSNAIKSIEDAIQHMIDEIKARTDLTDKEKQEAIAKLNQLKEQAIQLIQRAQSIDEITEQLEQFKAQMKAANPTAKELAKRKQEAISKIKDFSNEKMNSIRNSEIGSADEKQAAMNRINEIVLETIRDINNAHTLQQVEAALNNGIARISAVQIVTSDRAKQSSSTGNESNSHLTIGYGTANHPFNSSTIGHKKKLDEDDDIDPLHMRHFSNNFGNVIKNAIGVVGISGLLASFWFFIAKRRRKEDEEEELEIRDNNKDSIKETLDDTKHLPLLFAKRRRKEDEEDVTVEEKDSLNNGESLDKVKHTPFFLPKRRRKEDEEDVEVTNENTDEKVLKDNEHSPLLIAKRRKDKEENVETTTSIESKDEDVPLLLAKKKNQKDNQSKGEKSASKKPSKKVAAKKKKKKSKKNKK
ncbi:TPA: hyperosmolarity resistance protein Ebh [Staphylococcus aureus]|nr:hyperosmolarity resistance protein Ebh [Staphylococcus aureus]